MRGTDRMIATMMAAIIAMAAGIGAGAGAQTLTPAQRDALAGEIGERVPAGTADCVRRSPRLKQIVISDDVLVYRLGSKRFVSRTNGACHGLARGDKPVVSNERPRICAGDMIIVYDPVSDIRSGMCTMGAFAIYDMADKAKSQE